MGLGRTVIAWAVFSMGCATAQHAADLPAEAPPDAGEEGVASDMPKQGDSELAQSFDPEQPAKQDAPKPVALATGPAPGAEDEENARKAFEEQLAAARAALQSGKPEEGRAPLKSALEWAQRLFPPEQQRAAELGFELEKAVTDGPATVKAGLAWLASCGPDRLEACRGKVLATLAALAAKKDGPPGLKEKVRELRDADACLAKMGPHKSPGCAEQAAAAYRRAHDKLMQAKVLLARALTALAEEKKKDEGLVLLGRAEAECAELRCVAVRRRALAERRRLLARDGDLEGAARDALAEVKLIASLQPADKRVYVRTGEADRFCAQLDAKQGPGSCRKLEKHVNGEFSFKDFSAGKTLPGLGQDKVKEVNEHFACLLQECLAAQADRLRPPDSQTYEVRWMVLNDGRVGEVHLRNKDDDASPLAECLRRQFAVWRYPKYQGEFQHVEQSFIVTAHSHR